MRSASHAAAAAAFLLSLAIGMAPAAAITEADPVFVQLAGRWTGEGMLGLKSSPAERVKCRATYFINDMKDELKQTIRCATSAGNVEVLSNIKNTDGQLSGHWQETTHNFSGDLKGQLTPKGLRISVVGQDVNANMDVVIKGNRQVVEIQFINASLIGLTLLMNKG